MKYVKGCIHFSDEAINELKSSRLYPSIGIVIGAILFLFLLIAAAEILSGEVIHKYWTSLLTRYIFLKSFSLQYLIINFSFDVLFIVLLSFLPVITVLTIKKCTSSRKNLGKSFVFLTLPSVFLWHVFMFFLSTPQIFQGSISIDASADFWRYVLGISIVAQFLGWGTMFYGLINALGKISRRND